MSTTNKGQAQAVATTSPVAIFTPLFENVVKSITICNTSTSIVKLSLYRTIGTTTYDKTTALKYQVDVPARSTEQWEVYYGMNLGDNFAIEAGASDSITVTLDGMEWT